MKVKFTKFERVAGLFVLCSIVGCLAFVVAVAIKQGWFEAKVRFSTKLPTADGIHEGTAVQMAGLRVGQITEVELNSDHEVRVHFEVSHKFRNKLREDSVVRVIRPFVIGEKVLEVTIGSETSIALREGAFIHSVAGFDLMDLLSGRVLGTYMQGFGQIAENLRFVAEAMMDPERSKAFIEIFDDIRPLVRNMNHMSREATTLLGQVNHKKKLVHVLDNLVAMTDEMNRVLPTIKEHAPEMAGDVAKIARNMAVITDELQKTVPMMRELGPELPRASKRAIEALDETVVTLKALQKSFLLRGNVRDVRDEEAAREERLPASK